MLPALWDAWRGVPESGGGQSLTGVQILTLAPVLAAGFRLSPIEVVHDLRSVRAYVGGPAARTPGNAVTIGTNVYLHDARDVDRIFSFDHRRWLAHELGHTMQWRSQSPAKIGVLGKRDRAFMLDYGTKMLPGPGHGVGALIDGTVSWIRSRLPGSSRPKASWTDSVHDANTMEQQAERIARRFERLTTPPT